MNSFQFFELNDAEFNAIRQLVYDKVGINLTEKKRGLVRGRLNKYLNQKGHSSFTHYLEVLQKDESGEELIELINRLSTNHTFFFREAEHFDFLTEELFPRLEKTFAGEKEIRLWCAGCATGEEAYTLAITAEEYFQKSKNMRAKILATDISTRALNKALEARYPWERVSKVPPQLLNKYFTLRENREYQVKESLKSRILFRRLNFLEQEFPFKNQFHLIFCRNVMIYFDSATKEDLVKKFHRYLKDDQLLFIGHSETLGREQQFFRYLRPSIYQKNMKPIGVPG